jgi:hypothetical protein
VEATPRANIRPARGKNRDNDLPRWLLLRDCVMDEGTIGRLQQHRALWGAVKDLAVPPGPARRRTRNWQLAAARDAHLI